MPALRIACEEFAHAHNRPECPAHKQAQAKGRESRTILPCDGEIGVSSYFSHLSWITAVCAQECSSHSRHPSEFGDRGRRAPAVRKVSDHIVANLQASGRASRRPCIHSWTRTT